MLLPLPYITLENQVKAGAVRELHGRLLGRKHYFPNPRPYENNIDATVGEAGVNRWRGRWYEPLHRDPIGVVDVGRRGQVRNTKSRGKPVLRIYESDCDDHAFMLVDVVIRPYLGPGHFYDAMHECVEVLGWIEGRDAKQPQFERHYAEGGRCWELPPEALISVEPPPAAIPRAAVEQP